MSRVETVLKKVSELTPTDVVLHAGQRLTVKAVEPTHKDGLRVRLCGHEPLNVRWNDSLWVEVPDAPLKGSDDGDDDSAWVREPITPAEAKAGLRALGFIGLHDLTTGEMMALVALTGKLEALGEGR